MKARKALIALVALGVVGGGLWWAKRNAAQAPVLVYQVGSPEFARGAAAFNENCAACHGAGAAGTDQGPAFVDPVYRPTMHADAAFMLAARNGVRAHHWGFGDMPHRPDVDQAQIKDIVGYVRALQRKADVF